MGKKKQKTIKILKITEHKTNYFTPLIWTIISIGVIIRLALPFLNIDFSENEYSLAINILSRDFWGLFNPLDYSQTAPPLFMCLIKLCTIFSPVENLQTANFVFRIVPLCAGVLSIFAFYHLLTNIFVNRFVILIGLSLFAFNPALISYSYELKPYSTDVLVCILLMFYFIRYNPEGHWRQFIQTLTISATIMLSIPATFVISGGLIWGAFRDCRKFFYTISAFCLFLIFYFVYHLWGVLETNGARLDQLWTTFFVTPENIMSLGQIWTKYNLNTFILPHISLCVIGSGLFISFVRDKKLGIISTTTLLMLLTASYLHLFPFSPETSIFLIPIGVLLICQIPNLFSEHFWLSKVLPICFLGLVGYNLFFTNTVNIIENHTIVKNRLEPNKSKGCELIFRTKLLQDKFL